MARTAGVSAALQQLTRETSSDTVAEFDVYHRAGFAFKHVTH